MGAGYVGVSFFFILSGFILTYSRSHEYEQGRGLASKFWIARFARIYPVYLVSMLLAAYVNRAQFHNQIHLIAYLADLLMLQSWSIRMVAFFNVPAWSLSCEAFFYLLFPFIFLYLRPSSLKRGILMLGGTWILALAAPLVCLWFYPQASWHESVAAIANGGRQVFAFAVSPSWRCHNFLRAYRWDGFIFVIARVARWRLSWLAAECWSSSLYFCLRITFL